MVKVLETPSTTTAGTPSVEPLTGRNVAVRRVRSAAIAQPSELAFEPRADLTARSWREGMAGDEAPEHDELPQLVLPLAGAHPARTRRPAVAGELLVDVREAPSGARELEVHVVVLDHPQPGRIAADGARGVGPDGGGGARNRVLLGDLREAVHGVHRRVADVVVVASRVAHDMGVRVGEPHLRVVEAGEDVLEVVGLPLVVGVELRDEWSPRTAQGDVAAAGRTAVARRSDDAEPRVVQIGEHLGDRHLGGVVD